MKFNDYILGPGSRPAEQKLVWATTIISPFVLYFFIQEQHWQWWQYLLIYIFFADLAGGVVANTLGCAKQWWHRKGQSKWHLLSFNAGHVHPLVLAWCFSEVSWLAGVSLYGYLLLGTLIIINAPRYLQRPLSFLLLMIAVLLSQWLSLLPNVLEWFAFLFFLKLLVGHIVPEIYP